MICGPYNPFGKERRIMTGILCMIGTLAMGGSVASVEGRDGAARVVLRNERVELAVGKA